VTKHEKEAVIVGLLLILLGLLLGHKAAKGATGPGEQVTTKITPYEWGY
jgi:hypothetical protein